MKFPKPTVVIVHSRLQLTIVCQHREQTESSNALNSAGTEIMVGFGGVQSGVLQCPVPIFDAIDMITAINRVAEVNLDARPK